MATVLDRPAPTRRQARQPLPAEPTSDQRNNDTTDAGDIFSRAVCLILSIRAFSNRRKLALEKIGVRAKKAGTMAASKKRLLSPELEAIYKRDGQARESLYDLCLPSPLGEGSFLLPIGQIDPAERLIATYEAERGVLIEQFIATYAQRYDETSDVLSEIYTDETMRSIFSALDYPVSADELRLYPEKADLLREQFSVRFKYVRFTTPNELQTVDPMLFRREAQKAVAEWEDFRQNVTVILRNEMMELVNGMVTKLNNDGKRKVFRGTFVPNITQFLETFNDKNIVDDAALRQLVNQMRALMEGVNVEGLKTDADLRARISAGFRQIQTSLTTMLTDRPTRAISFVDE